LHQTTKQPQEKLSARRVWQSLLAIVALTLVGATVSAFLPGEDLRHYQLATASHGRVEQSITAMATLQPSEYVDVGAQVSGQLKKIHVKPGMPVEQGQLLAEIEATVPQAKVQAGRAQLQSLRAQLSERRAQAKLAEQVHLRQQKLMAAKATAAETAESADAAFRAAQAQVASIEAQIEQTASTLSADEASLGYTRIYAPISGTVLTLTARQGQTLNANQQAPIILRVADLSTMTVQAQVSEADVGRLKPGMSAYFTTLGRTNRRWHGSLREILPSPEVLNNVVMYNAQFDVDNPDRVLLPQMSAQVFFVQAAADDVIQVPVSAVLGLERGGRRDQPAQARVRVVEGGSVVERAVTVGIRNRVMAEIKSGLAEGEQVVVGRRDEGTDKSVASPKMSKPR